MSLWIYAHLHFPFIKMTNKNKYLSGLKKMKSKGTMDVVTHLPPQLPTLSGTIPFFLELSSISNFQKTKACYCWTHFLSHHFLSENVGNNRPWSSDATPACVCFGRKPGRWWYICSTCWMVLPQKTSPSLPLSWPLQRLPHSPGPFSSNQTEPAAYTRTFSSKSPPPRWRRLRFRGWFR